jgi:type IV pilus assembly protein PilB
VTIRLGEVLVSRGLLTEAQVDEVLEAQQQSQRPFGLLAEQMFGLTGSDIEGAWAEQYEAIAGSEDIARREPDPEALQALTRRQAWQFCVLPLGYEGSELVLATTSANLPRALRFAVRVLGRQAVFVLTDGVSLAEALERHFPCGGMGVQDILGASAA